MPKDIQLINKKNHLALPLAKLPLIAANADTSPPINADNKITVMEEVPIFRIPATLLANI